MAGSAMPAASAAATTHAGPKLRSENTAPTSTALNVRATVLVMAWFQEEIDRHDFI
jgi:hypothetical protein